MRYISFFGVASSLIIALSVSSCRRTPDPQPVFPGIEFFTPVQVADKDTVCLVGQGLSDATITVGGEEVSIVSNDGTLIKFIAPSDFDSTQITVTAGDPVEVLTFMGPIVNGLFPGNPEMLLGDFDGAGIRPANTSTDFLNGKWQGALSSGAATIGIGAPIESSPAGGNCAFATASLEAITGGFGSVATIGTRNANLNASTDAWPDNFFEYPNSPLDTSNASPSDQADDIYLNCYLFSDGNAQTLVRFFLVDPSLDKGARFAYSVRLNAPYSNGWTRFSVKLSDFRTNYGFNTTPCTYADLRKVNAIEIDIAERNASADDSPPQAPVAAYIDHVVLSQGGEAVLY